MRRRSFFNVSAGAAIGGGILPLAQQRAATAATATSGFAKINGLKLYYESHGTGDALILLHGGLGATGMFDPILPVLGAGRRIIAVDLQAHGRTADVDRPLAFETMAADISALARHLELDQADILGYSMGGGVALHVAALYPHLVRKLVVVSTAFRRGGWYPEIVAGMSQVGAQAAESMKQTPMYHLYASIAPRREDWPVLLTKMGALMRPDYDWSTKVRSVKAPALLAFGDADAVQPAHAVEFFRLLGGGKRDGGWDGSGISTARLAILPGLTHYNVFSSPALAATVASFLNVNITN